LRKEVSPWEQSQDSEPPTGTVIPRRFEQIIGNSTALESVLEQVQTRRATDSTALILGETGTGKELIAARFTI